MINKTKFKVGDKVKWVGDIDESPNEGEKGVIEDTANVDDDYDYNVRFEIEGLYPVYEREIKKIVCVSKKRVDAKKKKIIKEIKGNKEFSSCFEDVNEVNKWDDEKVMNWN